MAWVTDSSRTRSHPLLGVEALELHDAPARVGGGQHRGHRRDVVRRDADDGGLVLAGAPELERAHEVRREVQVAEHGGLRLAGGAAGEQQHRRGVGIAAPAVGLLDRLVLHGGEEVGARRRSRSRRRPRGASATPAPAITRAGAARCDDRAQPVVGQPVADRHEGLAGDGRAEQGDRHGRASSRRSAPRGRRAARASQVPARRARCPSSAKVSPPSSGPTATRSPRLSAAISRIIPTCMGSRALRPQSEDGRGLAPFTSSAVSPSESDPAPGLRAEQLDGLVLGDVALAHQGALVERGGRGRRRWWRRRTGTIGSPPQRRSTSPAPFTTTTSVAQVTDRRRAPGLATTDISLPLGSLRGPHSRQHLPAIESAIATLAARHGGGPVELGFTTMNTPEDVAPGRARPRPRGARVRRRSGSASTPTSRRPGARPTPPAATCRPPTGG